MSIGDVTTMERFGGQKAIVLGGSIAGLLAARVLSHHFDEVTLIERDKLGEEPTSRKGAPQGQHLHGLLQRGFQIMAELFPGIGEELQSGGAVELQMGKTFAWYHGNGFKVPCDGGPRALGMSRPFLEATIRKRVRAIKNVTVCDGYDVVGLLPRSDQRGIHGVKIKARTNPSEGLENEETAHADLVVDAMGRGSRSIRWMEELGYRRPEETEISVHVGYASRIYERRSPNDYPWSALYILGDKRMSAIFPIEGGRWISVVGGSLRDYPPEDEEGFLAFAKSLPASDAYEFFKREKPLSDIQSYRFPSNLRRHYERLARMPEGLCVLGDACVSFNPIYGQGMTTAALGSEMLDSCLKETRTKYGFGQLEGFSKRFQTQLGRAIDVPWMFSTSEDLAKEGVEGTRPPGFAAMRAYVDALRDLSLSNPDVVRHFYKVMHMIEAPTALFHPSIMWPVAKYSVGRMSSSVVSRP